MDKAGECAMRDFLMNYLQFNENELEKIVINETKVSAKGDDTIYAALGTSA